MVNTEPRISISPPEVDSPSNINSYMPLKDVFSGLNDEQTQETMEKIYRDYSLAIQMRNRSALSEYRFCNHFFYGGCIREPMAFGNQKNGYLLGVNYKELFIPTHFAPATLRGGYRLIKDLAQANIPTALFIPTDLVQTLKKMPEWKILPISITTSFRDEPIKKILVTNDLHSLLLLIPYAFHEFGPNKIRNLQDSLRETKKKLKTIAYKLLKEVPGAKSLELTGTDNDDI